MARRRKRWPPARQIVLLYDGAIRRIKEARRALEHGRINERYIAVDKATRDHRRPARLPRPRARRRHREASRPDLHLRRLPPAAHQSERRRRDLRRAGRCGSASCARPGRRSPSLGTAQVGAAPTATARAPRDPAVRPRSGHHLADLRRPRRRGGASASGLPAPRDRRRSRAILELTAGCSSSARFLYQASEQRDRRTGRRRRQPPAAPWTLRVQHRNRHEPRA